MFEEGKVAAGSRHHLRSVPSEVVARSFCSFHPHTVGGKRSRNSLGAGRGRSESTIKGGKPFLLCSINYILN